MLCNFAGPIWRYKEILGFGYAKKVEYPEAKTEMLAESDWRDYLSEMIVVNEENQENEKGTVA